MTRILTALLLSLAAPLGAQTIELSPLSDVSEPAWAWGAEAKVAWDGPRLYIPLGYRGLAIVDARYPPRARLLARVGMDVLLGQGGAVAAAGDRAYVATPELGMITVLDVSNPRQPQRLARFGNIPYIEQLALRGSHLFVYSRSDQITLGGVRVYNVSHTPPTLAGQYLTDLIDPGFTVTEARVVFLARTPATGGDTAKIDVVDMSTPASPRFLGRWSSPLAGNITDLDFRQGRLYCSAYWGGVWVLDARNPSGLALLASFDWTAEPPAIALSVQAEPPYVFVARGGPSPEDQRFVVFRQEGSTLVLEQEIAASRPPLSVVLQGPLLVTVELGSPYARDPRKLVSLYLLRKPSGPRGEILVAR